MLNLLDAPLAEHAHRIVRVQVAHAATGGWDVTAMVDAHVLVRQHCDDWHRVERAYQRLKSAAELHHFDVLSS